MVLPGAAVDEMVELLCVNLQKDELAALNTSMSAEGLSQKQQQDLVKVSGSPIPSPVLTAQVSHTHCDRGRYSVLSSSLAVRPTIDHVHRETLSMLAWTYSRSTLQHQGLDVVEVGVVVQAKVEEVEHALYGAQRAKEEATKRAALEERLAKRAADREKIEKAKDWSEEEVRMLEKALDKFPSVRTHQAVLTPHLTWHAAALSLQRSCCSEPCTVSGRAGTSELMRLLDMC